MNVVLIFVNCSTETETIQNSPGAGGSFPLAEEDSIGSGDNYNEEKTALNITINGQPL